MSEPVQRRHTAEEVGSILETIQVHIGSAVVGGNCKTEPHPGLHADLRIAGILSVHEIGPKHQPEVTGVVKSKGDKRETQCAYVRNDTVLPMALDVTDADQVRHVVRQAHAHFGKLDVVLNNAGYSLVGTVEEASEADVRAVFDTNYFGMLRVIQAALPLLRQQGSGHILGVSSGLGIVAMPLIGFYCASKSAPLPGIVAV